MSWPPRIIPALAEPKDQTATRDYVVLSAV